MLNTYMETRLYTKSEAQLCQGKQGCKASESKGVRVHELQAQDWSWDMTQYVRQYYYNRK